MPRVKTKHGFGAKKNAKENDKKNRVKNRTRLRDCTIIVRLTYATEEVHTHRLKLFEGLEVFNRVNHRSNVFFSFLNALRIYEILLYRATHNNLADTH